MFYVARFPVPKEKFIASFEEEKVSSSEEGFALIEDVRRSEQTGIPSSGTNKNLNDNAKANSIDTLVVLVDCNDPSSACSS